MRKSAFTDEIRILDHLGMVVRCNHKTTYVGLDYVPCENSHKQMEKKYI